MATLEHAELVARARGGDSEAFAELFRCWERPLLRAIQARLRPQLRRTIEAHDLLQETALASWIALPSLRSSEPAECFAWIVGIARRRVASAARDARAKSRPRRDAGLPIALMRPLPDELALESAEASTGSQCGDPRVPGALARLGADERAALVLRDLLGLSWESVAFVLARRVDAVRMLHLRATRRARRAAAERGSQPVAGRGFAGRYWRGQAASSKPYFTAAPSVR